MENNKFGLTLEHGVWYRYNQFLFKLNITGSEGRRIPSIAIDTSTNEVKRYNAHVNELRDVQNECERMSDQNTIEILYGR